MEITVKLFLDLIKLLHNIKPINLPEIPIFVAYLSFPVLIVFCYIVLPKIFVLLKNLKIAKLVEES